MNCQEDKDNKIVPGERIFSICSGDWKKSESITSIKFCFEGWTVFEHITRYDLC